MIPFLQKSAAFPPVENALDEPNGLLAAGGDLSTERLLQAYRSGIFPWFSDDEPIMWWSPNPRTIFSIEDFKPARSLCRFVSKSDLQVTLNKDFNGVINACAEPRINQSGTWITSEIIQAYQELHHCGFANSVEVWLDDHLVGGIYGVAIGQLFCGESMFSRISNGSKIALSCLIGYLRTANFQILDCQVENPHLMKLGAQNIDRSLFIDKVSELTAQPIPPDFWYPRKLDPKRFVRRN